MVAVFNKELLSWYLITLKLRETVEAGIANLPGTPTSTRSLELPEQSDQQQLQKQEQQPSDSLQIVIKGDNENFEEGHTSDSEWVISIKEKLEQAHQDDAAGSNGQDIQE
ncbi:hypothetical protein L1049_023955 [Liquidambar formosana]|uniref:Uncharacterized protein n=1 Tax=Liquidambar formosana TaxID=63359 RepID=A0AAP0RTP3_LIQFO